MKSVCQGDAYAAKRQAFFFDDFTAAFAVRRLVADFFGAPSTDLAFAAFRLGAFFDGPAAARAASRSSASLKVNSSMAVPFGSEAFVVPSVTYGPYRPSSSCTFSPVIGEASNTF